MNGKGVPVPVGPHSRSASGQFNPRGGDYAGAASGMGAFSGARSPPKAKNTSHVPCKFFPYGQCQAGAACQFSHDINPTGQNAPCKYFAKGSCKFGQGCALAHVLPDGRVINRPSRAQGGFNRRGHSASMNGAGMNSLLSMQVNDPMAPANVDPVAYIQPDQGLAYAYPPASPPFGPQQTAESPYGSPFGDTRLATSPPRGGLSALDSQLPKSFDSQGFSHAARHGPFAASLPGRFFVESPSASLPNRAQLGNTALRDTTFGDTANLDGVLHGLGSSPRDNPALDFSKRPLHSERFASRSRPSMMSSSLGVRPTMFGDTDESAEDESDDGAGEDLLPSSLHDLIPQEKLRRSSRNAFDDDSNALPMTSAQRRAISTGTGSADFKTGSLSPHSGSPSRYSSLWAARANNQKSENDSSFGHVGSPLRPSNLRSSSINMSTSPNNAAQDSMSILTSQLRNSSISGPTSHPGMSRNLSSTSNLGGRNGLGDRGFSSTSIGREKIDEEAMFSMEEDGEGSLSQSANSNAVHRSNKKDGGSMFDMGKSAATLSPLGGQRTK